MWYADMTWFHARRSINEFLSMGLRFSRAAVHGFTRIIFSTRPRYFRYGNLSSVILTKNIYLKCMNIYTDISVLK